MFCLIRVLICFLSYELFGPFLILHCIEPDSARLATLVATFLTTLGTPVQSHFSRSFEVCHVILSCHQPWFLSFSQSPRRTLLSYSASFRRCGGPKKHPRAAGEGEASAVLPSIVPFIVPFFLGSCFFPIDTTPMARCAWGLGEVAPLCDLCRLTDLRALPSLTFIPASKVGHPHAK